ncbi:MAG: GNAT family N-acetyltransferase [Coriobacteriales bacterium]|nr:GNAT family N-acetyltransferase [Coriobacteriales bacterium]
MKIRTARTSDAGRLLDIYAYYVEHTAISFECETPTIGEFANRIASTLERYPYLVIEDGGQAKGYAYAGPLKDRAAYDRSCEVSIYLDRDARGKGYGRVLYEELERRLGKMGMLNLYACIASPIVEDEYLTSNSEQFHAHMGFQRIGVFHKCGHKFGRWYNTVWMEKLIGEHA